MSGNLALYSFKVLNDHWKEGQKLVNWEVSVLCAITPANQDKTQKRLLGIFDFQPIYMKRLLSKKYICTKFSLKHEFITLYINSHRK